MGSVTSNKLQARSAAHLKLQEGKNGHKLPHRHDQATPLGPLEQRLSRAEERGAGRQLFSVRLQHQQERAHLRTTQSAQKPRQQERYLSRCLKYELIAAIP